MNLKPKNYKKTSATVHLAPIFGGRDKWINYVGIAAWLITLLVFWIWWLSPEHVFSIPRFALVSFLLMWATLIPAYFIFIFAKGKVPKKLKKTITGRIAMVVTKAPSEPFSIVKKTLNALLKQKGYSHDTWLADEYPSLETINWCEKRGVKISSRYGVEAYHRKIWPRRTRCKEGNLAYFYDRHGYKEYDFVSQFDADHVPDHNYLIEILRPFADPSVGYVSAPSICDKNAQNSWSARGRLYVEASMHGALQTGYNNGWAPLCIGSHYAVRTSALKHIGGLGPELAEDHSTTLLMNSGGWKGVHALNAIAHGEGPATFSDFAIQEFQWSRSLVTIMLEHSSIYFPTLSWRMRFQFLFSQLWYPMFSIIMLVMFLLPIIALSSGIHFVNVTYFNFFIHILPISVVLILLAYWWRSTGTYRPNDAKIISWESLAFLFARWPWSLIGSMAAIRDQIAGSFVDFRITRKGSAKSEYLPYRFLAPYAFLSLASSLFAFYITDAGTASGFYLFLIINALIYGTLLAQITIQHAHENALKIFPFTLVGGLQAIILSAVLIMPIAACEVRCPAGLKAFNIGITAFTLTKTSHRISGAGKGRVRQPIIRLLPRWNNTQERQILEENLNLIVQTKMEG
ncbi:MAG: glycosyltransferase [Rhizobiales bacterium]|nr:glycosyltransferase [Hyphomicrobiales bacterium]